jgi:hypothetical protein
MPGQESDWLLLKSIIRFAAAIGNPTATYYGFVELALASQF